MIPEDPWYDSADGILCRPGGPRDPNTPGPYCGPLRCYCPGSPDRVVSNNRRSKVPALHTAGVYDPAVHHAVRMPVYRVSR